MWRAITCTLCVHSMAELVLSLVLLHYNVASTLVWQAASLKPNCLVLAFCDQAMCH